MGSLQEAGGEEGVRRHHDGADSMSPSRLDKAAAVIAMGVFRVIQGWKNQRTFITGV